ncbi:MAG: DUF5693 family protein [Synergistaceae bacterium]
MLKQKNLTYLIFFIVFVLATIGVVPRYINEQKNKNVAFIVDYKDFVSLSIDKKMTLPDYWKKLSDIGFTGVAVSEYTGEELTDFNPLPIKYGSSAQFPLLELPITEERAVIVIDNKGKNELKERVSQFLSRKFKNLDIIERGNFTVFVLPDSLEQLKFSAILPDFNALDFCVKNNIKTVFRPGACHLSNGEETASSWRYLFEEYNNIVAVLPSGMVMPGYPQTLPLVNLLKEKSIVFIQVEFVKQVGVSQFMSSMKNGIISLHSLTRDETLSKKISSIQVIERYIRAVHERSIRMVLLRPYDINMGNRSASFVKDTLLLKKEVENRGYNLAWPKPLPFWNSTLFGAVAVALALVFSVWAYLIQYRGKEEESASFRQLFSVLIVSLLLAILLVKVGIVSRLAGGITGAFVATIATIYALQSHENRVKGATVSLFIIVAGGLSIASFYGTSMSALRLTPFSGVKLTLLLPPILLLFHDFKRRIHPESISEIIARPALWSELMLLGFALLALAIMALRSDNVSNVPAVELAFREFMERVMSLRPRTKEFVVGYPMLVIYWYLVRKNYLARYREVLRIATSLAFCSAINTFCHFHTEIILSVTRVFNGWWLGLIIGCLLVALLNYFIIPLLYKSQEFFSRD